VIRLGLRLAVSGGREAVVRLIVLAAAVGIGVGLLLAVVAAVNAVGVQNDRYAWLDTGGPAATCAGEVCTHTTKSAAAGGQATTAPSRDMRNAKRLTMYQGFSHSFPHEDCTDT
jgi:hypothetical protein